MPAVTRELSITYAGITIGGTSDNYLLFDRYTLGGSESEIWFRGRVACRSATESDFATKRAALEAAFQTPDGTLVVTQGSSTMRSFGATANTGFLGKPSWRKVGGPEDTGRSCLYEVSVTATRPADRSGGNGLRVARIELSTKFMGDRSYTVSGTYTALSSNTAKQQYTASVGAFLTALETDLTGSWARMDATVGWDDRNKLATFTQTAFEEGLRGAEYALSTTLDGLRSYRVTGAVAGDGTTDTAKALYDAGVSGWLDAFETALSGTWMRGPSSWRRDGANKVLVFEYAAVEVGARDVTYRVETDLSGIRSYVVTGFYTANGGTGALANYTANIGALLSALETLLTGTWEREQTQTSQSQGDKTCGFFAGGRELIANQSNGVLNNASIKQQQITVFPREFAPGDNALATPPVELVVQYQAAVEKTVALAAFFDSTVKPFLVQHARNVAGAAQVALVECRPGLDIAASRINASLTLVAYGAAIHSYALEQGEEITPGVELVPVWAKDPDGWAEMEGRRRRMLMYTETFATRGAYPPVPFEDAGPGRAGWRLLLTRWKIRPVRVGLVEASVSVIGGQREHVLQFRNPISATSGASKSSDARGGRIETSGGTGDTLPGGDA